MQTIGVKDGTFQDLPEIRHLCPCSLLVHECEARGRKFKIGLVDHCPRVPDFKPVAIYPLGDTLAYKTCLVVYGKEAPNG